MKNNFTFYLDMIQQITNDVLKIISFHKKSFHRSYCFQIKKVNTHLISDKFGFQNTRDDGRKHVQP